MFGWLAKMLMQTPVASSGCACCEGKRERLEQMRRELAGETHEKDVSQSQFPQHFSSGSYRVEVQQDGSFQVEIYTKPVEKECGCGCGNGGECCGDGSCGCGHCHH